LPILSKYIKFKISPSILKEPLKFGYPLLPSGYSNLLIQSGDRYVLRIFQSVSNVGLYSFGYTIARTIEILLVEPLAHSFTPTIRKLESNPSEQKRFLRNSATFSYIVGIFIALGLSLFCKEVIMLLARKKEFWQSWVIVPVIAFSYVQHAVSHFFGCGMAMKNKSYHISGILLVSACVNIGLNFIFIPYWGILGAAFATLISYIVWNGLKMYYSAKFYDLHFDLNRLGFITLVGIGLYLGGLFVADTDSLFLNIGIKFLVLLVYPFLFFIVNFFTPREKEYIWKLWSSLKSDGVWATLAKIKTG